MLFFALATALFQLALQSSRLTEIHVNQKMTQIAALNAARIALSELQQIAGIDCVVTSEIFNESTGDSEINLIGAWNVKNPPAELPSKIEANVGVPLVSNFQSAGTTL